MASPRFVESKDFYKYIETTLDYEIAEKIKDDMKIITEAYGKYVHTVDIIKRDVDRYIRSLENRKEQALAIQQQWSGWMIPLAFTILDNKDIDDKMIHKSMERIMEL
jgi:hypothetical protein